MNKKDFHLAQFRAYIRIARQRRWTRWQSDHYERIADMHLKEAQKIGKKRDD